VYPIRHVGIRKIRSSSSKVETWKTSSVCIDRPQHPLLVVTPHFIQHDRNIMHDPRDHSDFRPRPGPFDRQREERYLLGERGSWIRSPMSKRRTACGAGEGRWEGRARRIVVDLEWDGWTLRDDAAHFALPGFRMAPIYTRPGGMQGRTEDRGRVAGRGIVVLVLFSVWPEPDSCKMHVHASFGDPFHSCIA
jgi:hypothetical protein